MKRSRDEKEPAKSTQGKKISPAEKRLRVLKEANKMVAESAKSLNFTQPPFRVVESNTQKGRVCVASQDLSPGTIILSEEAFEYALESAACICCDVYHEFTDCEKVDEQFAYAYETWEGEETLAELLSTIQDFCFTNSKLAAVFETTDQVKTFLKCMARFHRQPSSFKIVLSLSSVNEEKCLVAVKRLRKEFPMIFPTGFNNARAAKVLAVLNTNCHELDHLGGSGIFLATLMTEHSCDPNCSFTTFGSRIWVTVIKEVKAGDPLSIDYGNNYYRPTVERKEDLLRRYGFECACPMCTSDADPSQSFSCSRCNDTEGIDFFCQSGKINLTNGIWKCSDCGYKPSEQVVQKMLASESFFKENFPQSVSDIEQTLLQHKLIHPAHYCVFWALHGIASSMDASIEGASDEACKLWKILILQLETLIPTHHHEKVIFYDAYAQAHVIKGDISAAKEAYSKAYQESCFVSGKEMPATLEIKKLMENPPTTKEELILRYQKRK